MGIKQLNKLLQQKCGSAINIITFSDLSGKCIAIDTSIYMYKFMGDGALMENVYLMISLFRHYNIHPIFVFDGKPPPEKSELLNTRKITKQNAETEYKRLEQTLSAEGMDDASKIQISHTMETLKRQFTRIRETDIHRVKALMKAYGVAYVNAPGEADVLCAKLVLSNKAYACVSEDTDLFVYGCPVVLRYMSMLNQTFIMYDLRKILECLQMSQDEFREICIISGTDYNMGGLGLTPPPQPQEMTESVAVACGVAGGTGNNTNTQKRRGIFTSMDYFKKYKEFAQTNATEYTPTFYNWLLQTTKYVDMQEDETVMRLYGLCEMFSSHASASVYDEMCHKIEIRNADRNKARIRDIMEKYNFIFI